MAYHENAMFFNDFGWNSMKTVGCSMISDEIAWKLDVDQWFQMAYHENTMLFNDFWWNSMKTQCF